MATWTQGSKTVPVPCCIWSVARIPLPQQPIALMITVHLQSNKSRAPVYNIQHQVRYPSISCPVRRALFCTLVQFIKWGDTNLTPGLTYNVQNALFVNGSGQPQQNKTDRSAVRKRPLNQQGCGGGAGFFWKKIKVPGPGWSQKQKQKQKKPTGPNPAK